MIDHDAVRFVDEWLDREVSGSYREQPLAQDWARVAKVAEEAGEAVAELILLTGQNPRKGKDDGARDRLLNELADTAMAAVYAIQHFTKDAILTSAALDEAQRRHMHRALPDADR